MSIFQKILQICARPFIGSGISQKLPALHAAYKMLYRSGKQTVATFKIPCDISLGVVTSDTGPGLYLATKGEYEPFETQLFAALVKSGDVIYDIGAHVGYYALPAAKLTGEKGKVFAFEPSEQNITLLEGNIAKNKIKNIQVIKRAVSSRNGIASFYLAKTSSGDNSLLPIDKSVAVEVPVITVDAFVKESGSAPTIIKIDVEGNETKVIDGMTKTLKSKSLHVIFCELTPAKEDIHAVIAKVIAFGFSAKVIDEANKKLLPYTKSSANLVAKKHGYVNLLFQK